MKTSIIICFYERLEYLRCCLDTLQNSAGDFDEVIIADDGSSESCVAKLNELIKKYDFPIIHAWHFDKGFRVAAARNNGIRHASGEYLIFFDCDFLILPGTIKTHLRFAKPGRFLAGWCKYLTENQTGQVLNSMITGELLENFYNELSERELIKDHRRYIKRSIFRRLHLMNVRKQHMGGHFSIYRKDIESVNGYDENFQGWGGEDDDLGLRLLMAGLRGYPVIRTARVLHLWHQRELGGKHWIEGTNTEYFQRKTIPFYCENGLFKTDSNYSGT